MAEKFGVLLAVCEELGGRALDSERFGYTLAGITCLFLLIAIVAVIA